MVPSKLLSSILYLEEDLQLFFINRKWSQKWRILRPVPDLQRCFFFCAVSHFRWSVRRKRSGTGREIPPFLASLFGRDVLLQIYIEPTGGAILRNFGKESDINQTLPSIFWLNSFRSNKLFLKLIRLLSTLVFSQPYFRLEVVYLIQHEGGKREKYTTLCIYGGFYTRIKRSLSPPNWKKRSYQIFNSISTRIFLSF